MANTIKTGVILPRDYGIVIKTRYQKHFVSPLKYAIAKLMLETKDEIDARLEKFANEYNYKTREVKTEFKLAVKKKEGKNSILETERKNALFDVKNYNGLYTAKVQSKSNKVGTFYEVQLKGSRLNFEDEFQVAEMRCDCSDSFWTDVKRRTSNCVHTSALEMALYLDNKSRESSENNLTGLMRAERPRQILLPFELAINPKLNNLLTQSLWQYYVENRSGLDVNKYLLENPEIYSDALKNLLNNNYDKAQFGVLRQIEKQKQRIDLSETQKRVYGASKILEERIREKLNTLGFRFQGYGLEFKGTDSETVASRFRCANEIYSICSSENMPPILVRKFLGSKDNFSFKYESKPLDFSGEKYIDIDDSTRRESLTQVFIPGEIKGSDIFVPEMLKERYAKLKQGELF